jgi:peroxiredoxin Q/BCP
MRRVGSTLCRVAALLAACTALPAAALEVGDKAPDFTLPATTAEKLSLAEYAGKKNVVLFGFIGAFTPT